MGRRPACRFQGSSRHSGARLAALAPTGAGYQRRGRTGDAHGLGIGPILLRAHHARADTLGFIGTRHTAIERFIGVEVEEKEAQAQQVWIPPVGRVCVIPILRHFRPKNARHNLYFLTAHGILTYLGSNKLFWVQKPSLQVTLEHNALVIAGDDALLSIFI